jgi:molecular chaperone HscB
MPQPLQSGTVRDPFEAFQAPRRFAQDRAALQKRFLDLSRSLHPDRFARASEAIRQASLERMGLVNEAYRLLTDRNAVREYLLAEAGLAGKPVRSMDDLELAERWFELQEQVVELDDPREPIEKFAAGLQALIAQAQERMQELEKKFDAGEGSGHEAPETLREVSAAAQKGNTLRSMLRDVERLKARVGLG